MCILIASIICYATDGARYGRSGVASETAIGFGISNISQHFPFARSATEEVARNTFMALAAAAIMTDDVVLFSANFATYGSFSRDRRG